MKEMRVNISFDLCLDIEKAERSLGTKVKRREGDIEDLAEMIKSVLGKRFNIDDYQSIENLQVEEVQE